MVRRWLKEVEAVHSQGGLVQPRDVEKSLLKRLRLLGLPPRFAGQLDEAEALMGDNMLRILRAGRIESPDFGFAMLAHEVTPSGPALTLAPNPNPSADSQPQRRALSTTSKPSSSD